jgi:hypothetical protein
MNKLERRLNRDRPEGQELGGEHSSSIAADDTSRTHSLAKDTKEPVVTADSVLDFTSKVVAQ